MRYPAISTPTQVDAASEADQIDELIAAAEQAMTTSPDYHVYTGPVAAGALALIAIARLLRQQAEG